MWHVKWCHNDMSNWHWNWARSQVDIIWHVTCRCQGENTSAPLELRVVTVSSSLPADVTEHSLDSFCDENHCEQFYNMFRLATSEMAILSQNYYSPPISPRYAGMRNVREGLDAYIRSVKSLVWQVFAKSVICWTYSRWRFLQKLVILSSLRCGCTR